jgi:hypothetical protein
MTYAELCCSTPERKRRFISTSGILTLPIDEQGGRTLTLSTGEKVRLQPDGDLVVVTEPESEE